MRRTVGTEKSSLPLHTGYRYCDRQRIRLTYGLKDRQEIMIVIELITASVLCLLHLVAGLAIGWKTGHVAARWVRMSDPFLSAFARTQSTEAQRIMSQWFDLRLRLSELSSCVRQCRELPQELIAQWRSELVQLTDELYQALDRRISAADSTPSMSKELPPATNNSVDELGLPQEAISNAQIIELLEGQHFGCESHDESVPLVRYRFSVKQPLAPAVNNSPLAAEAFSMVQFHDLSIKDVRYFVDDTPTEDKVVIGLGVPKPVKWLAAEVEDFRSVFMYGRVGYLVTARLLASIDKRLDSPVLVH